MAIAKFSPSGLPGYRHRWMMFVDGEHLAMRATAVAKARGHELTASGRFEPDVFFWFNSEPLSMFSSLMHPKIERLCTRAYYYTSCQGDDKRRQTIYDSLWRLGFLPHVFHKPQKDKKSKGVDIMLTKDVLSHAFLGNYEAAILVAGDGDYVPLVQEVQRLGKIVCVAAFKSKEGGLNDELRRACDVLIELDEHLG
jgi:uncharacterized LabA/DUF88 family protein